MVVRARQSLQSSKQNTWFLENNETLSKFSYDIFLYSIGINLASQLELNALKTSSGSFHCTVQIAMWLTVFTLGSVSNKFLSLIRAALSNIQKENTYHPLITTPTFGTMPYKSTK